MQCFYTSYFNMYQFDVILHLNYMHWMLSIRKSSKKETPYKITIFTIFSPKKSSEIIILDIKDSNQFSVETRSCDCLFVVAMALGDCC